MLINCATSYLSVLAVPAHATERGGEKLPAAVRGSNLKFLTTLLNAGHGPEEKDSRDITPSMNRRKPYRGNRFEAIGSKQSVEASGRGEQGRIDPSHDYREIASPQAR